jgi:hypothetical protein
MSSNDSLKIRDIIIAVIVAAILFILIYGTEQ